MNAWRDRLERWFRPIAMASPLSPNQITVVAFVINLTAAIAMVLATDHPDLWLAVPLLVTIGGLLDALDGVVARVRQQSSLFGDFLDHSLDRASDSALLIGWLVGTSQRSWLGLVAVAAVLFVGYLGTQIEASWSTRSYSDVGRGEFMIAIFILPIAAWILGRLEMLDRVLYGFTIPEWISILLVIVMLISIAQRFRRASLLPESADQTKV